MSIGADATQHVARVKRFYDRNTERFRRRGQGGAAMHRAVWGPGVTSRDEAFTYVEERIVALLAQAARPRVVDLGCGVGGSLIHLATRRSDLAGDGLTISSTQADVASSLIERAGLAGRVRVQEGDFLSPPPDLAAADLVFSIEAFAHSPDPVAYFRAAAGLLRPAGVLVVCDDLLTTTGAAATAKTARRLHEFREGWRLASLVSIEEAAKCAAAAGLVIVGNEDLTMHLDLGRPRDRALGVLAALGRRLPRLGEYWASLAGGVALQHCLSQGLVNYRLLVFRRGDANTVASP